MQFGSYKKVYVQICTSKGLGVEDDRKIYVLYIAFLGKKRGVKIVAKREIRGWRGWVAMYVVRPAWLFLYALEIKMRG